MKGGGRRHPSRVGNRRVIATSDINCARSLLLLQGFQLFSYVICLSRFQITFLAINVRQLEGFFQQSSMLFFQLLFFAFAKSEQRSLLK